MITLFVCPSLFLATLMVGSFSPVCNNLVKWRLHLEWEEKQKSRLLFSLSVLHLRAASHKQNSSLMHIYSMIWPCSKISEQTAANLSTVLYYWYYTCQMGWNKRFYKVIWTLFFQKKIVRWRLCKSSSDFVAILRLFYCKVAVKTD